ncbi:MAG: lytic transglycosylase F, partial [bacterium]|nr:lytic transglycosylase F [bacterium]
MKSNQALLTLCMFTILSCLCIPVTGDQDPSQEIVAPTTSEEVDREVLLTRTNEPFTGDLDEIRERRHIRVLVSYSRTNFFFDRGRHRGFEYELMQQYETFLNQTVKGNYNRIRVFFVPVPFDQLLPSLRAGLGDVAAAGLTASLERVAEVAFTNPYLRNVREVVVQSKSTPPIRSLDDLAGKTVPVRSGSSYIAHLENLSQALQAKGLPPIHILNADPSLGTEDILELVNAGIVDLTVADQHIAEAWAEVLTQTTVRDDVIVHTGGGIAWALRETNPLLLDSLNAFVAKNRKGTLMGNILHTRYFDKSRWIQNPLSAGELAKLDTLIELFQKYGKMYNFDWLALAAQAYQESGLDNSKRSHAGAVGIMQIKPSTAADKNVAVSDVHLLENNIHAGAKYLQFIRNRYFSNPEIDAAAKMDFTWA